MFLGRIDFVYKDQTSKLIEKLLRAPCYVVWILQCDLFVHHGIAEGGMHYP